MDHDDDPRRSRRRAHRAAVPAAGLRVHAGRARLARRRRARRAAIDPHRVRGRPAPRRRPEPRRRLQRRHPPAFLSDLSGLKSSVPFLLVIVLCSSSAATDAGARSVADDVPRPDHREGLSKWRRRLPWALLTLILIAFSSRWFGVGLAPGRRLRPDRHRPEPRDGDHLPVVRGRHRHERQGEPDAGELRDRRRLRGRAGRSPTTSGVDIPGCSPAGQINFFWAVVIGAVVAAAARRAARAAATRLGGVNFASGHWRGRSSSRWCRVRPTPSATARAAGRSAPRRSTSPASTGSTTSSSHKLAWTGEVARPRWTSACCRSRSCCSSPCSGCSPWSSTR